MHAEVIQNHNTPEVAALPLRAHTILGVCEAIGEDFGISPMWLRVPFAASVLISPIYAVAAYFAVGLIVLGSRLAFPARRQLTATATDRQQAVVTADQEKTTELPLAA